MAVAMILPEPKTREQAGKQKGVKSFNTSRSEQVLISQARTVFRWLPVLADKVLAGTTSLNDALSLATGSREALQRVQS